MHTKMLEYSKELNKFYCDNKALWQVDFDWRGFRWIDCNDNENSVISFIRYAEDQDDFIVVVLQLYAGSTSRLPYRRTG